MKRGALLLKLLWMFEDATLFEEEEKQLFDSMTGSHRMTA